MTRLILTTLFCLTITICFGQTQLQMNDNAANNYQKADRELNIAYKKILAEYEDDTAFTENLKAAQRIWIQFRNAEMKVKYPDRKEGYYGSVHPMCWYMYMTDLTNARITTLNVWLTGIEEGDVCSGSVKIKK